MNNAVDRLAPHLACRAAWSFVRKANAYVEESSPWSLAKDEAQKRRLEVVLYSLADALRLMVLMASPAIPRAAATLWQRLGQDGAPEDHSFESQGRWSLLAAGTKVHKGEPLFPRLVESEGEKTG
jgi:methionyl-tRNA synthetase